MEEIDHFKKKISEQDENAIILARLFDARIINENGVQKIDKK